jgi:hypothetical protein
MRKNRILSAISEYEKFVKYVLDLKKPELIAASLPYKDVFYDLKHDLFNNPKIINMDYVNKLQTDISSCSTYVFFGREALMYKEPFNTDKENTYTDCLYSFANAIPLLLEEEINLGVEED